MNIKEVKNGRSLVTWINAVTSVNGDNFMQVWKVANNCRIQGSGWVAQYLISCAYLSLHFPVPQLLRRHFYLPFFLSASTQTALCFVRSNLFLSFSFPWLRPSHDLFNLSCKERFDSHSSFSTIQRHSLHAWCTLCMIRAQCVICTVQLVDIHCSLKPVQI